MAWRSIGDKVLVLIVDAHEKAETYPAGCSPNSERPDCSACRSPRNGVAAASRSRSTCRCSKKSPPAGRRSRRPSACTACRRTLLAYGTDEQRRRWLPGMLGGEQIGAYSLSEPQAGSDAAALRCAATRSEDGYVINGSKSWITHGGRADFYTLFARTSEGSRGVSCFLPGDLPDLSFGMPEEKMGLAAVPTTSAFYDHAHVDADRLIGAEGEGLQIAFSALDSGRLGIAAVAVGLAQAALDEATSYANERTTFGRTIIDHQGLGFLLADMAAAVGGSTRRRPASPS